MNFVEKEVTKNGRRLSARIAGTGNPVVLFHSLLANSFSFEPFAELLSSTHKVHLVDLPGFGQSTPIPGDLTVIADHLAACLPELVGSTSFTLIGNGYGGFLSLITTIRHPHLIDKLVLADCGACFSDAGRQAFINMSKTASEKGLIGIADVAMRRLFSESFQQQHPELSAKCREKFLSTSTDTFHQACIALSTLDVRENLHSVRCPVLVMVGEFDEATPPVMSEELGAKLPNATYKVLDDCAHVPQLQAPELFHREVKAFI